MLLCEIVNDAEQQVSRKVSKRFKSAGFYAESYITDVTINQDTSLDHLMFNIRYGSFILIYCT